MVHYDPTIYTAPKPPTLCPKCGSHRTEVVGKSLDDKVLIVRCNGCGERSEIPNQDFSDHFAAETAAMDRISRALPEPGDPAFSRAVRWGTEQT